MGCGCNSGPVAMAPAAWIVSKPDGTHVSYRTEVEASAAALRTPGSTYAPQKS